MIIYERLIIDIESGEILEEQSFDYNGAIALCKGSVEAPQKTETEQAIDAEQLAILKDYRASQKEMEPFILESIGYERNAEGTIVKSSKKDPEDILQEKELALKGYSLTGEKLTEDQMLNFMTDAEKLEYQNAKLNQQRLKDAYEGKLEISPALEAELSTEEKQAQEVLARKLGNNWAQSTSGQQLMKAIKQKNNLVREEARRGMITTAEGVSASKTNQATMRSQNATALENTFATSEADRVNRLMGIASSKMGGWNEYMDLTNKYTSERANRQNINAQAAASQASSRTAMTSAGISAGGMAAAAAAK